MLTPGAWTSRLRRHRSARIKQVSRIRLRHLADRPPSLLDPVETGEAGALHRIGDRDPHALGKPSAMPASDPSSVSREECPEHRADEHRTRQQDERERYRSEQRQLDGRDRDSSASDEA